MAAGCGNVIFPGWITHAEIWALMRRSAVGLAPYADTDNFRSGLPNKPIEYFSAGLPVLSSVNGVLGELLRTHQCGVVYRSGDAAHLAAKLAELYDDSALRRRMGANALALFEQRFTAERVYSQMADYLERVARDRR
jgi:glycosyltransferase involved in cell wall biosynthesis